LRFFAGVAEVDSVFAVVFNAGQRLPVDSGVNGA
jgi:hypothetical protein